MQPWLARSDIVSCKDPKFLEFERQGMPEYDTADTWTLRVQTEGYSLAGLLSTDSSQEIQRSSAEANRGENGKNGCTSSDAMGNISSHIPKPSADQSLELADGILASAKERQAEENRRKCGHL